MQEAAGEGEIQAHDGVAGQEMVRNTIMDLALNGELLFRAGKLHEAVEYFEAALKYKCDDDKTESAIYSHLGNAYFYMGDYGQALIYHEKDKELLNRKGEREAEAIACGNLGNTYKMLGKFDEAVMNCRRHLEICRQLEPPDRRGEGKALYNLGNVYHTKGKRMIGASEQEPGEVSQDIRASLQEAIKYYEENLTVVNQLEDMESMGKAYGNLGNVHYLLGNFEQAVEHHKKRLQLARKLMDKSAERRAHLNLGNANVFLGNFQEAVENYKSTLELAQELEDKFTEAHSCYSLANTYTFLRNYESAIEYHLKYLDMIKESDDKLGEGRACWSLVNIYLMVNNSEKALEFARRHAVIAEELGDKAGLASARLNIEELEAIMEQKQQALASQQQQQSELVHSDATTTTTAQQQTSVKKLTPESLNVVRLTPDKRQEQEQRRFKKQLNSNLTIDIDGVARKRPPSRAPNDRGVVKSSSSERLFDMIAHFQSGRIDDQRCEILNKTSNSAIKSKLYNKDMDKENHQQQMQMQMQKKGSISSQEANDATDAAARAARASSSRGSHPSIGNPLNAVSSAIKATYRKASLVAYPTSGAPPIQSQRRPTVSAEHREQLFDLIAGAQNQRMDEQRAALPTTHHLANGILRNPINSSINLAVNRGHTIDQACSSSAAASGAIRRATGAGLPATIQENRASLRSQTSMLNKTPATVPTSSSSEGNNFATTTTTTSAIASSNQVKAKLTRHFQTVDAAPHHGQQHDDRFLDSLMKYQSTRFNDQRTEKPNNNNNNKSNKGAGDADNFFNLIVRFQSDRIDDQRSAPPPKNKNI